MNHQSPTDEVGKLAVALVASAPDAEPVMQAIAAFFRGRFPDVSPQTTLVAMLGIAASCFQHMPEGQERVEAVAGSIKLFADMAASSSGVTVTEDVDALDSPPPEEPVPPAPDARQQAAMAFARSILTEAAPDDVSRLLDAIRGSLAGATFAAGLSALCAAIADAGRKADPVATALIGAGHVITAHFRAQQSTAAYATLHPSAMALAAAEVQGHG